MYKIADGRIVVYTHEEAMSCGLIKEESVENGNYNPYAPIDDDDWDNLEMEKIIF